MSIMTSKESLTLAIDEFARSVSVNRSTPFAFFLGAGASISSQIPSADDCVWEWKRQILLTKHPELERQFRNISLPSVRNTLQQWLDDEGEYPLVGSEEEYGFYIEHCYPLEDDRRQYFENILRNGKPHAGYKFLCLLAQEEIIRSIWTTNFDGLVAKAGAMYGLNCIEIGLDTTGRIERPIRKEELRIMALHGDFRYDALKNTPSELKEQDETFRKALVRELRDVNLVVTGYSGRDKSVMDALMEAYSLPGSGRLYWCGYGGSYPPSRIRELVETARSTGRTAFYVPTEGFDDTMFRLATACLTDERKTEMVTLRTNITVKPPEFTVARKRLVGFGKINAFACRLPSQLLTFEMNYHGGHLWRELRGATEGTGIIAIPFQKQVFCMGNPDEATLVLKDFVKGPATYTDTKLVADKSAIQSLLLNGLVRSVAKRYGLGYIDKGLLWELKPSRKVTVRGRQCLVYEAASLYLRRFAKRFYIVLKPTIRGTTLDDELLSSEDDKELKRQELSGQYNNQFNKVLKAWNDRLFPSVTNHLQYPDVPSTTFEIQRAPLYAGVGSMSTRQREIVLPEKVKRFISIYGEEVDEPFLLFTDRTSSRERRDIFPLRGMMENRPYDYSLTQSGLKTEVRVGVVSPAKDARTLHSFLQGLNNVKTADKMDEYWLDFPGFPNCFGLPLRLPEPYSAGWAICSEPDFGADAPTGSLDLVHKLESCIDAVRSSTSPNVIIVFIPSRWQAWESFDSPNEFDLHDVIKAYCVQQGIASQLLRESTLMGQSPSRIAWGLALQLYVKSMRTPWTLEQMSHDTAFVGLGYSMRFEPLEKGKRIVLGCSHIYGSNGLGLQYKLRQIQNPIIIQDNPHMNYDDARRTAETVRELFFESLHQLPKRVVFHKNTPFLREERQGLLDGLEDVENVDMIEAVIDNGMRFIASVMKQGDIDADGYPVKRGTTIVLDDNKALVWIHGSTESVHPNRRYYLGKRRIPAPLLVTRHHGTSSLRTITRELLGLSKMDWNSVDMYNKMPATIQSARKIAQIGSLLKGFQPQAYDYRLFI